MKKAFTIVELLVVMAVIGILITLAVVGIQALQKSQRETVRQKDVRNISATLASYYTKNRAYPISDAADKAATVAAAAGTTNLIYTGGSNPTITFTNLGTVTPSTFSLALSGLGAKIHSVDDWGALGANVACTLGAAEGAQVLGPTADQWYIMYRATTASPQSYTLAACTENGWSANFGTKID